MPFPPKILPPTYPPLSSIICLISSAVYFLASKVRYKLISPSTCKLLGIESILEKDKYNCSPTFKLSGSDLILV